MAEQTRLMPGQLAVVTGAGSGIGRALAVALADAGLHVALAGRDGDKLAETAALIGPLAEVVQADITNEADRARIAAHCVTGLHVLAHSAGRYLRTPFADLAAADWRELDEINLHAPLLLTAACLSALRAAKGQVVFINSTAVQRAAPGTGGYAASKHALKAAADALRQEVNGDSVRVLSIFPGRTDTPMQQAILGAEGRTSRPGALLRPEDVARMALAALSLPDSAEVTDIVMRPMRPL